MKEIKRIHSYLLKYKYSLLLGIFITILARVFSLFMPEYVEESLDVVARYINSEHKDSAQIRRTLIYYILIIVGSSLLSGVFTFWMRQIIINISRYVEFDMKNRIFSHYEKLSPSFYKGQRTGDMMTRISEDVAKVRMYVGPAVMYSVQTITLFVCVVPLMVYASPTLAFYTLIPLPLLSILIYHISRSINRRTTRVQQFLSQFSAFSQETFSGVNIIKAYSIEHVINTDASILAEEGRKKSMKLAQIQAWFGPLMIFLIGISGVFVTFIGGKLYINGSIDIGVIAKYSIYIIMLTWPVATIGWVSSIVQQAVASQKRIDEFLNEVPEIQNQTKERTPVVGNICFKNVSFTHKGSNIEVLKNVSFAIQQGQTVAIMGKVGSGKSTILDLIVRLHDVSDGEVCVDNKSVKDFNLQDLRNAIGYVPQDSFLFSDTVSNNILFGNPNASVQDIERAAQEAALYNDVMGFSKGFETVVGERGITLSGGQKQRMCIARVILKSPNVYLFDDPLSAVDNETESSIMANINKISNRTLVMITNRVSTAKNADFIIVMEQGRISQMGNHESLSTQDGYYKKVCQHQYRNQ